jgi:hypothetical protein
MLHGASSICSLGSFALIWPSSARCSGWKFLQFFRLTAIKWEQNRACSSQQQWLKSPHQTIPLFVACFFGSKSASPFRVRLIELITSF